MKTKLPLLEHLLPGQLGTSYYLVVENLRGISPGWPFTWNPKETHGEIIGVARFYPDAQKLIPRPSWPVGEEARAKIEKHFPPTSIQLSCGGAVDERQPLSFDDHPNSLFAEKNKWSRDRRLFGRTFTILWMPTGDEQQIASAIANDRPLLEKKAAMEWERLHSYSCWLSHCPDELIQQWFHQWYVSRLCRLDSEPSIDAERLEQIFAST